MSATMNFSRTWNRHFVDNSSLPWLNTKQNRLTVSYASIGGNSIPRVSNIVLLKEFGFEINDKKIKYQLFAILTYPPEIKNSQEMLLYWIQYTPKIGETFFETEVVFYAVVALMRHYLVFKNSETVRVLDLNTTNEVVCIKYGKVKSLKIKYMMKFVATSANNVESEFVVVSDSVIKSPSHTKITELTEEQYLAMKREKLFKQ